MVLNNDTLWIVGGHDGYHELSSTEFVSINKSPVPGPPLPFTISWHTMVQYDSNSIFIIGGKQGHNFPGGDTFGRESCTSNKTWIGKARIHISSEMKIQTQKKNIFFSYSSQSE